MTVHSMALTEQRTRLVQQHVQQIAKATPAAPDAGVTPPSSPLSSPAYWLALIPVLDVIATTFFHKDLGLGANAQQWAVLAAAIVGMGAFISRAVKHHAAGQVQAAWLSFLEAVVKETGGLPVDSAANDGAVSAESGGEGPTVSSGASVLPRTGSVSTTRAAVAKKTTTRRGR